jgi:hypothetical protein
VVEAFNPRGKEGRCTQNFSRRTRLKYNSWKIRRGQTNNIKVDLKLCFMTLSWCTCLRIGKVFPNTTTSVRAPRKVQHFLTELLLAFWRTTLFHSVSYVQSTFPCWYLRMLVYLNFIFSPLSFYNCAWIGYQTSNDNVRFRFIATQRRNGNQIPQHSARMLFSQSVSFDCLLCSPYSRSFCSNFTLF